MSSEELSILVLKRGIYRVATSLVSSQGDRAEEVAYLSGLKRVVRDRLLAALERRRVHLSNRRGY